MMRVSLSSFLFVAPLVLAAPALPACGDDDATPKDTATLQDQTVADAGDTSVATDTTADDTQVASDTTPEDTNAPDVADSADGGDTSSAAPACDYVFTAQVSHIHKMAVGSVAEGEQPADHCCFDFDDDADPDNRIGEIAKLVEGLPQIKSKINDVLAKNIDDGTIGVLVELVGAADLSAAQNVTLHAFYGKATETEGDFTANLSSFVPDSDTPRVAFEGVTIANHNLFAGPSVFRLTVPIAPGLVIDADIEQARIEGTANAAASGFALDGTTSDGAGGTYGAKLGGVIPEAHLFNAFNTFAASRCACLSLGGASELLSKASGDWQCADNMDSSACDSEDTVEKQCITLSQICSLALAFITPDIDTDNSGSPDAFSVGLWLKGEGAALVGVEPATCKPD